MTVDDTASHAGPPHNPPIRTGTLWAGGLATAVVAALVAAVGVVVSEGVLSINLLHVGLPGNSRTVNWIAYPTIAFALALVATGVLHLLLILVPQPMRFFGWIIGLVGVLAAALPFASGLSTRTIVTSIVDLLTVLAIWALLSSIGSRARRPAPAHGPAPGSVTE